MKVRPELISHLASVFEPLKNAPRRTIPRGGFLSKSLEEVIANAQGLVWADTDLVRAFGTAAIEAWLRAVHSFLVSCSVTVISPIWASVAGYYASHYAIRAIAHALGHFQLFRLKKVIRLEFGKDGYYCAVEAKRSHDREHLYYWRVVKDHPQFAQDPLFRRNVAVDDSSDAMHREYCNYADHVNVFPAWRALDLESLRNRIARIAGIRLGAPPIPQLSRFPDVESVQIVAYHRIVRFRQLLDEGIGTRNRFWSTHRQPSWVSDLMSFQLTEQGDLQYNVPL